MGAGTVGISWLQATKLHYQWIEVVLSSFSKVLAACSRQVRALRGLFLVDLQDRGKFGGSKLPVARK